MSKHWRAVLIGILCITQFRATPSVAQISVPQIPPPRHALALADIGRSGLRGLFSASGGIGDLQNRAGSYKMAVQMERARVGPLEGLISELEAALANPGLPDGERAAILQVREATLAELEAVPRYDARYTTATLQAEALIPFGFVRDRPLFLLVRGRGHARGGGSDGLTVLSEGVSFSPLLLASPRWIVAPGLAVGQVDVDIAPFDGSSSAMSVGPQLTVGGILGEGWGLSAQLGHSWGFGRSTILRPQRHGSVEVRSSGWSETTTAKAELVGRLPIALRHPSVEVRPRVGAFLSSTRSHPTTNNLGEVSTGPLGPRESVAAVRGGASFNGSVGAWSPSVYLGWEQELTEEMAVLVNDRGAFQAAARTGWTWGRGRRVVVDYSLLRGGAGLRRASDFTIVVIIDG